MSSDRDEASFNEYYGEMPWLALPFADREIKAKLSKKFKVQGIPMLVLLDGDGNLITTDGRSAISSDPSGASFPWKPKSVNELLGDEFIGPSGPVPRSAIEGKSIALYFSAHW